MFERNCPRCNIILEYKLKSSLLRANKKNSHCFKCCNIGQIISLEQRLKISKALKGKKGNSGSYKKGDNSGERSPMYGKSIYICLVEKYGKEEADIRYAKIRKNISIRHSGKGNSSYGKNNKQGNGYSGWYKDWYFRSITELSYIIKIESEGKKWVSAENLGFHIEYIGEKGTDRTYRPDFLIEDKYLIEIKPLKLQNTPMNLAKKEAALKFCKENNYEYIVTDCEKIDIDLLKSMYDSKIIKFTEKTEKKFNKYYNREKKKKATKK